MMIWFPVTILSNSLDLPALPLRITSVEPGEEACLCCACCRGDAGAGLFHHLSDERHHVIKLRGRPCRPNCLNTLVARFAVAVTEISGPVPSQPETPASCSGSQWRTCLVQPSGGHLDRLPRNRHERYGNRTCRTPQGEPSAGAPA
jgi:hypothetical protein